MNTPSAIADPLPLRILALPGDGIGREVVPAAVAVLQATGLPFAFAFGEVGWDCFERHGTSLPDETLAAARAADAILFGAVASPSHPVAGYRSPIVALRRELDLYANIRPVSAASQAPRIGCANAQFVDLVVVRENTEGLYAGRERVVQGGDTAIAERVITQRASERIARVAFELARSRGMMNDQRRSSPSVTIVHKANILRATCGLFRAAALRVAAEYPDVAADELLVDTAALQLVQRPERFDVIVTTNLFGDILSDVASYWGGGLGLAASANIGDRQALFEPVHGSAPDIAGQGVANPLAAIGAAALLLDYLGGSQHMHGTAAARAPGASLQNRCREWAERIRSAMQATQAAGICTPDLGGAARTAEVTDAVLTAIAVV